MTELSFKLAKLYQDPKRENMPKNVKRQTADVRRKTPSRVSNLWTGRVDVSYLPSYVSQESNKENTSVFLQKKAKVHRLNYTLFTLAFLMSFNLLFAQKNGSTVLNAAFLCLDGVYNSELMAPYDILQHSIYRDSSNYIRCFIVTPDGRPFVSSEGIRMIPHYSFADCPDVDILVIPSTETSMNKDLQNKKYIAWIKKTVAAASHIITACDGAFPLAATGSLNGRVATTFPGDRQALATMFPKVDVRFDVNFVADGKFITSVGGALSYQPALYLTEILYSKENAERTAEGLVLNWDLNAVPHLVIDSEVAD